MPRTSRGVRRSEVHVQPEQARPAVRCADADVHHYFQSIRPDVLKKDVAKYLHDPDCLALACQIVQAATGDKTIVGRN